VADRLEELLAQLDKAQDSTSDERTKKELARIGKALREELQKQQDERNKLAEELHRSEGRIAELQAQIAKLEETAAEQARELEKLRKEQKPEEKAPSTASPLGVANAFREVVEKIQTEARESAEVGTTIRSLEVEVKGFVQVEEGEVTSLAFPKPDTEVQPEALSTLRVSFGAIPAVTAPPEEEQPRATPSRRRRRSGR
jgi:chromosome segregation ATPase